MEKGLVEGEPAVFARNRLVVIVPRTNPGAHRAAAGPRPPGHQDRAGGRGGAGRASTAGTRCQKLAGAEGYPDGVRPPGAGQRGVAGGEREERGGQGAAGRGRRGDGLPLGRDAGGRALRARVRDPRAVQRHRRATRSRCSSGRRQRRGGPASSWTWCASDEGQRVLQRHGLLPGRGAPRRQPAPEARAGLYRPGDRARGPSPCVAIAGVLARPAPRLLGLPVLSLILRVSPGGLLDRLREPLVLQALRLSLITSLAATATVVALGLPVAYLLAMRRVPRQARCSRR